MKTCPECGKQIAEEAENCPQCTEQKGNSSAQSGWPIWKRTLLYVAFLLGIFTALFLHFYHLRSDEVLRVYCVTRLDHDELVGIIGAALVGAFIIMIPLSTIAQSFIPPRRPPSVLTILMGIGVFGIYFALALPAFMIFSNPHESVVRSLRQIRQLENEYHSEHGTYANSFRDLGWRPQAGDRYAYYLPGEVIENQKCHAIPLPANIRPQVSASGFLVVAAGDKDGKGTPDIRTINENDDMRRLTR